MCLAERMELFSVTPVMNIIYARILKSYNYIMELENITFPSYYTTNKF